MKKKIIVKCVCVKLSDIINIIINQFIINSNIYIFYVYNTITNRSYLQIKKPFLYCIKYIKKYFEFFKNWYNIHQKIYAKSVREI